MPKPRGRPTKRHHMFGMSFPWQIFYTLAALTRQDGVSGNVEEDFGKRRHCIVGMISVQRLAGVIQPTYYLGGLFVVM